MERAPVGKKTLKIHASFKQKSNGLFWMYPWMIKTI